jgi:hypothetical protein
MKKLLAFISRIAGAKQKNRETRAIFTPEARATVSRSGSEVVFSVDAATQESEEKATTEDAAQQENDFKLRAA